MVPGQSGSPLQPSRCHDGRDDSGVHVVRVGSLTRYGALTVVWIAGVALAMLPAQPGAAASSCTPEVSSLSPDVVFVTDEVTIAGSCFGAEQGSGDVRLGAVSLKIREWGDTLIVAQVLSTGSTLTGDVVVNTGNGRSLPILLGVYNFSQRTPADEVKPGEVFIRVRPGADPLAIASAHDATVVGPLFPPTGDETLSRWWRLSVALGEEVPKMEELAGDAQVEWSNAPLSTGGGVAVVPNDPCYPDPTDFACPVVVGQWGAEKIDAPGAWDISTGSSSLSIAVIDSGADLSNHNDLWSQSAGEVDLTGTGLASGCPLSAPDHGTHVSGIASANTDNFVGMAGIGWDTKLRSYKIAVDTFEGGQWECRLAACEYLGQAIVMAVLDGADVINMSVISCEPSQNEQDAVDYAWNNGLILVGSAGNDGEEAVIYPAAYDHVISVAASTESDGLASFSNYGPDVDIAAPGVQILSTVMAGTPFGTYDYKQGTSMAAPFVSGVAALLLANGTGQCEAVQSILLSADPISWEVATGRLNAGAALFLGEIYQCDGDLDGVPDSVDNCPTLSNPTQTDTDGDALGDACDPDDDNDTVLDFADNCPLVFNPTQANFDGDSQGDACDPEDDGDGFTDVDEVWIGTDPLDNCGDHTTTDPIYSQAWAGDVYSKGPFSTNRVDLQDVTSFIVPIRRLDASPGDPDFHIRWDLAPGFSIFEDQINIQDLTKLTTVRPDMFGGERAFDYPTPCTP